MPYFFLQNFKVVHLRQCNTPRDAPAVESSEGISLPQKNWHIYKSVKYWLEYIVIPHRL